MTSRLWRSDGADSVGRTGVAEDAELVLVRHGTSTRAQIGIWGRTNDTPLAAGFEEELAGTKSALQFLDDPVVFSSPLARCRETAAFIFPKREIKLVSELRAYHSGELEYMTEADIRMRYPGYLDLSFGERFRHPAFGEESMAAQAQRVAEGLAQIVRECVNNTVIVAHFSSINVIAHIVSRNFDTTTYADGTYDIRDGGYMRLGFDPSVVLNDLMNHFGSGTSKSAIKREWGNEYNRDTA